jgi:hypothetical protein
MKLGRFLLAIKLFFRLKGGNALHLDYLEITSL